MSVDGAESRPGLGWCRPHAAPLQGSDPLVLRCCLCARGRDTTHSQVLWLVAPCKVLVKER